MWTARAEWGSKDGGWSICQLGQPYTAPDCCCSLKARLRPWPESSPVWSDTVSYRRPGSVPPPNDTRAEGPGFRRRRGQMTCMPLGSSEGGRLFKKGLWAGWGVCVFVCERRRLSATQLRRGPLIPMLAYCMFAKHHTGTGVLWHLQTGGRTHSGLPMVFINLFSFQQQPTHL